MKESTKDNVQAWLVIVSFLFFCAVAYATIARVVYAGRERYNTPCPVVSIDPNWDGRYSQAYAEGYNNMMRGFCERDRDSHASDSAVYSFFWPLYVPYHIVLGVSAKLAAPIVTTLSHRSNHD